jgi:hypothetical protein
MEENIMLIVSDETYDRTAAESVRPSSENRHTTARSGEIVESVIRSVLGRVVDIRASKNERCGCANVTAPRSNKKAVRVMLHNGVRVSD